MMVLTQIQLTLGSTWGTGDIPKQMDAPFQNMLLLALLSALGQKISIVRDEPSCRLREVLEQTGPRCFKVG